MKTFLILVKRNCKLFFRDKGVFLPSLIAPLILLFLFVAFLGNVYRDSITSALTGISVSGKQVESIAAGWLLSTLLSVCAVTIAFNANTVMVQDRVQGQAADFAVTPMPRSFVALAYFVSTFVATAVICYAAFAAGLVYVGIAGWRLSVQDLFLAVADVAVLTLFGTAISSVVCHFIRSQGGVAAVQATVSAAYGFLCGAYMPISSLAPWLGHILMFLPGTYGTQLLHVHLMRGAIDALADYGAGEEMREALNAGFDLKLDFFGAPVPVWACYLALLLSILLFTALYVVLCAARFKKK